MRVQLHIGPDKTGTTSVQSYLLERFGSAEPRGDLWYPRPSKQGPGHADLALSIRNDDVGNATPLRAVVEKASAAGVQALLLSSEVFLHAFPDRLARLADALAGHRITLLTTQTSVPDRVASLWQERVKHGHLLGLPESADLILGHRPFRPGFLRGFAEALDPVEIAIVYSHPSDESNLLIRRVGTAMGLPGTDESPTSESVRHNESLGLIEVETMRRLNELLMLHSPERRDGSHQALRRVLWNAFRSHPWQQQGAHVRIETPQSVIDAALEVASRLAEEIEELETVWTVRSFGDPGTLRVVSAAPIAQQANMPTSRRASGADVATNRAASKAGSPSADRPRPVFCSACATWCPALIADRAGRRRGCPTCLSVERHRVLGLLLPALVARSPKPTTVLDVAPSRSTDGVLAELGRVVRMDFDPAADGRLVDIRGSLTAIPLADGTVDLVVCSHVLEHVPDDRAAMRELARVLAPGGVGVVMVPWRSGPTDEDPTAPEDERVRRFGQADHVRYYGEDFTDRLGEAGLTWTELTVGELLAEDVLSMIRAVAGERLWLVGRADGGTSPPGTADLVEHARSALLARLSTAGERGQMEPRTDPTPALRERIARLELEASQTASDAAHWHKAYHRLRSRPPIRALAAVNRTAQRLRSAVGALRR